MLEVADLRHSFGRSVALDAVSFEVAEGEIVGLVGRNGAGKTTAMRSIMGILRPDSGEVRWRGHRLAERDRLCFGYMPEERGLYPQMRVLEQVAYFAALHGADDRVAVARAGDWLRRLGLIARANDRLIALSHGNQQRIQLAVALVHEPELLVLDEPFAGLDPEAVDALSEVIRELSADGISVLFSSHQLELVERICRRVVILDSGRVIAAGTLAELRKRFPAQLRVKVGARDDWARSLRGVQLAASDDAGVLLTLEPGVDTQEILRAAQAAGPVEHFAFETRGLIDLYRQMVAG